MPDETVQPQPDEQVGLDSPEAFEITTDGTSVTGKRLFADGGDGQEKEVNVQDPVAGASSTAPASSGIPSAMKQQGIATGNVAAEGAAADKTPMADRDIPARQDLEP